MTAEKIILDMLASGLQLGIQTLKSSVTEPDRPSVESIMDRLKASGQVVEVKKNRYQLIQ